MGNQKANSITILLIGLGCLLGICSLFEAYRVIVFEVLKKLRELSGVSISTVELRLVATQLSLRIPIALLIVGAVSFLLGKLKPKKEAIPSSKSPLAAAYFLIFFALGYFYVHWDALYELELRLPLLGYHKSPSLFLSFIPKGVFQIVIEYSPFVFAIFPMVMLWLVLNRYFQLSYTLLASGFLLSLIIQAFINGFGKLDHTFTSLNYLCIVLIGTGIGFFNSPQTCHWQLARAAVIACYFFSGVEKILISGFGWADPENFDYYLNLQNKPLGLAVTQSDLLLQLLPVTVLVAQVFSPLFLLNKVLRLTGFAFFMLFHLGTYLLMGAGAWFSPWQLALVILLPWEEIK